MVLSGGDSAPSGLLSPAENEKVFQVLQHSHHKNQSLSTAVVKIYLTDKGSGHRHWEEMLMGVACLVKDFWRKSYFIQIIDMQFYQQVWEQELYLEMKYVAPSAWFHMFEADNSQAALSFADEREGVNFHQVVLAMIERNRTKHFKIMVAKAEQERAALPVLVVDNLTTMKKKDTKKKLEIGAPILGSFIHIDGIRPDGQGGMKRVDNSSKLDPVLRTYLNMAGIDVSSMGAKDIDAAKKTAKELGIYQMADEKKILRRASRRVPPQRAGLVSPVQRQPGGLAAAETVRPPPIPRRADPPAAPWSGASPLLGQRPAGGGPPPTRPGIGGRKPPETKPLPPLSSPAGSPAPRLPPPLPRPVPQQGSARSPTPAVPQTAGRGPPVAAAAAPSPPPPPPPPPPPDQGAMLESPEATKEVLAPMGAGSPAARKPVGALVGGGSERGDLLSDIRNWNQRVQLRPRLGNEATEDRSSASRPDASKDITDIMRNALGDFREAVAGDSDSDDDDDSDGWDSDSNA